MLVSVSSIQPCFISTLIGDCRFIHPSHSLHRLFRCNPGNKHVSMQYSRRFSRLTDFLFNRRNVDELPNTKRKRLRPGEISPPRPVPEHIKRPPYVKSRKPPGIGSGFEVHDRKGIEKMRASGRLAALVLQYAGTLVKVLYRVPVTETQCRVWCGGMLHLARHYDR